MIPSLQVHQSRVQHCPPSLPSELYWYGGTRSRPGRPYKKTLKQPVPLVTEIKMHSPIRAPEGTGDDINQLSQPNTKDKVKRNLNLILQCQQTIHYEKQKIQHQQSHKDVIFLLQLSNRGVVK